jgi:hypothetical protein
MSCLQVHIQIGVVVPDLRWLPAAVLEWDLWASRRLAAQYGPALHRLFAPPADIIGIHSVGWAVLQEVAAAFILRRLHA